ncbi:MAG: Glu-tRNA(Gln) amidotransferase subunit GatE [Nitrososphaerota archaeon]|nr:Glu-tRNA(Gln) amidotransferase subunit GatE [Nitrososphaerota archaeon]
MLKSPIDFKSIKLKVGLEVHQQLATSTKLFCGCPPYSGEGAEEAKGYEFRRILRPASSELGEVDEAAQFESRREIRVRYVVDKNTSCLVEADEEPPHPISEEALETALLFSLALKSRIADEIHVMRKIVVDGSNTSGFQRTAVVALGGELDYGGRKVAVQSIGLEEDAARAVRDEKAADGERTYALDRLGTPLVEVALAPIEGTSQDIEDAAKTIGRMMRSTGRVARGLGTIRQDLNISVMGGKVIEVKGVQRLDQIRSVVEFESARQKFFHDLADEIRKKVGETPEVHETDVTDLFRDSKSAVIKKSLAQPDATVACLSILGFAGFIGRENEFHSRLGKEFGAIAKSYGLGGVFHSDELPNYGITAEEVEKLRSHLKLKKDDAFVLIAGDRRRTERVVEALKSRIRHSAIGVPAETRAASVEGETAFLRPRPGAARMYPETDIPLIPISREELEALRAKIPEPWEIQVSKFAKTFDLPGQLAEPLYDSDRRELFERVVKEKQLAPRFVASALIDTFLSLSRDGVPVSSLTDERVFEVFSGISSGLFAKEAFPAVVRQLAKDPKISLEEALSRAGVGKISREELEKIIDEIIVQNISLVKAKGVTASLSTLMGKVMQRVRGKADGKLVNELLASRLAEREKANQ